MSWGSWLCKNNSERPVDALALILEKGESLSDWLTDNLKSRDASASKNHSPLKTKLQDQYCNISECCPMSFSDFHFPITW